MAIRSLVPEELGKPLGMYSHGVEAPAGDLVVVAGQVGVDGQGQVAGPDVASQTRQAFRNIGAVLAAGTCRWSDVVRLQTFLTSPDDIPGFMKAREALFPQLFPGGAYPPNTLLVVSRLVRADLCVEIEAMAVRAPRPVAAARTGKAKARKPAARRRRG